MSEKSGHPLIGRRWALWSRLPRYGDTLYKRATGELPEMESSKSLVEVLEPHITPGTTLLDVGCGAGHYYRSFSAAWGDRLDYHGVDATDHYVDLARRAFPERASRFSVGDIYGLDHSDRAFDVVISCNLLLHLPAVAKPISECLRVARRLVVFRTLVGESTYIIKQVRNRRHGDEFDIDPGDELDEQGEPRVFNYFNIYSRDYLQTCVERTGRPATIEFLEDRGYSSDAIEKSYRGEFEAGPGATRILAGRQVVDDIICRWHFVLVAL